MKRFISKLLVMALIVGFGAVATAGLVYERVEAADTADTSVYPASHPNYVKPAPTGTGTAAVQNDSDCKALDFEWVKYVGPAISTD
ncbi:MAG: hypothetical protein A4E64_02722 [Syntrophorhabdus sp. PtaU1.Bin058]|nr:MAG: hypothetical protein A4E64_02722 [Syntrophorhabdus sp. PtaU1.Bin058]